MFPFQVSILIIFFTPVYLSIEFSRDLTAVWFDPWVLPRDSNGAMDAYDEYDLIEMLSTISTRFSKVIVRDVNEFGNYPKDSQVLIPSAAAKFNKFQNEATLPMEVIMTYVPQLDKNTFSNFDLTKIIADQANEDYPGTVTTFMLRYDAGISSENIRNFTRTLIYAREQISKERKYPYKLGVYLPIRDCGKTELLQQFMNLTDINIFSRWTEDSEYFIQLETAFKRIIHDMKFCIESVSSWNKNGPVGFFTDRSDTPPNGDQNIDALVTFWENMNEAVEQTNTPLCFYEAFNNFHRSQESWKTEGWWTVREVDNGVSHFAFQEKAGVLGRSQLRFGNDSRLPFQGSFHNSEPPAPAYREANRKIMTIVILATTAVLVLIGSVVAAMIIMYRKIVRKMDNHKLLGSEDIEDFFEGGSSTYYTLGYMSPDAENAPYDRNLEMKTDSFTIENGGFLGMGNFGTVLRATILKPEVKEVAVKTTKTHCPSTALKGLLSEIKILAYIGDHQDIVKLVGAYTSELSRGKVYVFFELCSNGSLEKYLRSHRNSLTGSSYHKTGILPPFSYVNVQELESVDENSAHEVVNDSSDLHKWAVEIARGMEYLATKRVIHGDLATRNILLTSERSVKISDFGLSRRLYEYTNYKKTQQEPMPWRWMAPESLRCLDFSEKSDVWAFGVTLWEIFSIGEIPYPGLTWNVNFVKQLNDGLRPDRPQFCPDYIYEAMKKCWNDSPDFRPSFSDLMTMICNYSSLD